MTSARLHVLDHRLQVLATRTFAVLLAAAALCGASSARAQDIEAGATTATRYDAPPPRREGGSSVRIGAQLRLDALNSLAMSDRTPGNANTIGRRLLVPLVTPGVRLVDGKLFLGLGLGFNGWETEEPNGDTTSRSGFSLSPVVTYDVLSDSSAALSLNGTINLASLGETERCNNNGNCADSNDDTFGIGLSLGAGVRGFVTQGLAIGADFGWGFLSASSDNDDDEFVHGLYGALLVEATIGT